MQENDYKSIMKKQLTRKEIVEQLAIARKNAEEGRVMEAHQAYRIIPAATVGFVV